MLPLHRQSVNFLSSSLGPWETTLHPHLSRLVSSSVSDTSRVPEPSIQHDNNRIFNRGYFSQVVPISSVSRDQFFTWFTQELWKLRQIGLRNLASQYRLPSDVRSGERRLLIQWRSFEALKEGHRLLEGRGPISALSVQAKLWPISDPNTTTLSMIGVSPHMSATEIRKQFPYLSPPVRLYAYVGYTKNNLTVVDWECKNNEEVLEAIERGPNDPLDNPWDLSATGTLFRILADIYEEPKGAMRTRTRKRSAKHKS
ncbi:hypothetical protein BT69DRAFT_1291181, partial [Atractiella rhizophila]